MTTKIMAGMVALIGLLFAGCYDVGLVHSVTQDVEARKQREIAVRKQHRDQVSRLERFSETCPSLRLVSSSDPERYQFSGCGRTYVYTCKGEVKVMTVASFVDAVDFGKLKGCRLLEAYHRG